MEYFLQSSSDHCPILLHLMRERGSCIKYFRFQRMWGTHEGFLPLVREAWNQNVDGSPMVKVSRKLQILKSMLRKWNIDIFGQVHLELANVEARMVKVEDMLRIGKMSYWFVNKAIFKGFIEKRLWDVKNLVLNG